MCTIFRSYTLSPCHSSTITFSLQTTFSKTVWFIRYQFSNPILSSRIQKDESTLPSHSTPYYLSSTAGNPISSPLAIGTNYPFHLGVVRSHHPPSVREKHSMQALPHPSHAHHPVSNWSDSVIHNIISTRLQHFVDSHVL